MATQLQRLRSIPLADFSIKSDSSDSFKDYITGIVSENIDNVQHTLSANAFVSRNGLSASSIKCNGPIAASGTISANGSLSAGSATLTDIRLTSGYSISRTEDRGALQITGGKISDNGIFNNDDANGRLILYGKTNELSGYAILKAQGNNSKAQVLAGHSVILSAGNKNAVIIGGDSLTYTGSNVIGNGFARAGSPGNSPSYITGFLGLTTSFEGEKTFQRQATSSGWITIWAQFPDETTTRLSIKSGNTQDDTTYLVDIRRTTSDCRHITMSFPIAAGQWAEFYCQKAPTILSIDRFYYAIGSIVSTTTSTSTRGVDRNGASSRVTYDSIAGDVINDNGLDGLANNGTYENTNIQDPNPITLPDDVASNQPDER